MKVAHSNITDELKITSKFLNFSFLIKTSNGFFFTDEFGSNCTSRSSDAYYRGYVNETRQFMVSYRGRTLKYYCSSISFHGSGTGENRRDKYKVCVTLKEFTDPDCALRLNFTNNLFGPILQVQCFS